MKKLIPLLLLLPCLVDGQITEIGEYYLAGYARRLDNGISSKPCISNEFAILDLNPPAAIFYIVVERVPIK